MIYFIVFQHKIIYHYTLTDFSLKISFFGIFCSIFAFSATCAPENPDFLTNRRAKKKAA